MLNSLNHAIYSGLSELSQLSPVVSNLMSFLLNEAFFKGGLIMALFWGLWFTPDKKGELGTNRATIIAIIFGGFLSLLLARVLAVTLPFVVRPLNDPNFICLLPSQLSKTMESWSAFPSDHAALFSALGAGLWFISRPLAAITMTYVIVIIFIPRIYLGLHYPVDIIGGMTIGIASVVFANISTVKKFLTKPFIDWSEKHPNYFYCFFFIYSFQICTLFNSVRCIGNASLKLMKFGF